MLRKGIVIFRNPGRDGSSSLLTLLVIVYLSSSPVIAEFFVSKQMWLSTGNKMNILSLQFASLQGFLFLLVSSAVSHVHDDDTHTVLYPNY